MARSKKVYGNCSICGNHAKLTYEHVPPESAFNDRPVLVAEFEAVINQVPGERPSKYQVRQRGSGNYTLCDSCNTKTGDWYAKHYAYWCYQAMELILKSRGRPTLLYPYKIFPLAVFKQIMTMFCSINGPGFADRHPELVDFLLCKERMYLDPKYSVFAYLNVEGTSLRRAGLTGIGDVLNTGRFNLISEISHPPFGFVLALAGGAPDNRLVDIGFFARYAYEELATIHMKLPVLATHLWIPGDYRTISEIVEQRIRSESQLPLEQGRAPVED